MEIKDFCKGIQHVGIPTNDMDKTIRFYERLGFHVAWASEGRPVRVVFLQLHNLIIEAYEEAASMKNGAIDHVALDVKDIDTLYEVVKAQGFHLLSDHVESLPFWEKGVKFFLILGPNKERIEFCERL